MTDRPPDRPTNQRTTRLLELLRAAKKGACKTTEKYLPVLLVVSDEVVGEDVVEDVGRVDGAAAVEHHAAGHLDGGVGGER